MHHRIVTNNKQSMIPAPCLKRELTLPLFLSKPLSLAPVVLLPILDVILVKKYRFIVSNARLRVIEC